MTKEANIHGAIRIELHELPFFRSMKIVQDNTGLTEDELLSCNSGFRALPRRCGCGHEWSVFDIVINAVQQEEHDWSFFRSTLVGEFGGFFFRRTDLTCHCGVTSKDIGVLYKYQTSKVQGWGY